MRIIGLMLALLLWVSPARAAFEPENKPAFLDGNYLWGVCESENRADEAFCTGAILGLHDGLAEHDLVCSPKEVTRQQVRDVVVNYLRDRPERRQYRAYGLAYDALVEFWPCP
jgi:hypothetical protein